MRERRRPPSTRRLAVALLVSAAAFGVGAAVGLTGGGDHRRAETAPVARDQPGPAAVRIVRLVPSDLGPMRTAAPAVIRGTPTPATRAPVVVRPAPTPAPAGPPDAGPNAPSQTTSFDSSG